MGDRCTGHCCRRFYLPYSPEELRKCLENTEAYTDANGWKTPHPELPRQTQDIDKLVDMTIYLGAFKADVHGEPREVPQHHYTCKYLDTVSGNCLNYENRPRTCSGYPHYAEHGRNAVCLYKDCEWDAGKVPLPIVTAEVKLEPIDVHGTEVHELWPAGRDPVTSEREG